jgi:hypothetical protein
MGKGTVEKFGLKAIVDTLDGLDVLTARDKIVGSCRRGCGRFGKSSKSGEAGRTMQVSD